MKRLFAHYTLIRLLPLADAGEFVNIGVVLACPEIGYFGFKILRKPKRVTHFFEEISSELLTNLRKTLSADLNYLGDIINKRPDRSVFKQVMQNLVKPRESMIRYAPLRGIMTEDCTVELERIFERYIQRDLSAPQPQYHEGVMTRLVKRTLASENLADSFVASDVGTDDFHIHLPFVHERNGLIAAIKPLDLTHDEPTKIYTHGDLWLGYIRRLNSLNLQPKGLLIATEGPDVSDSNRFRAYSNVINELKDLSVTVVDRTDTRRIVDFAKTYVQ